MDRGRRAHVDWPRPARVGSSAAQTGEQDEALARIAELSKMARTTWFGLLAYLTFVGITLLAVQDADFFVPARQTQLPLVQVSIPTAAFFWFAPILGTALYAFLHLQLVKLWQALAPPPKGPPPVVGGRPLGDRVFPWLVNDVALSLRPDDAVPHRPLRWLASLVTRVLVWAAGPFVLAGFWWRSMPAHEEWLTLFLALCLCLSLYVGLSSWWALKDNMAGRQLRRWRGTWRAPAGIAIVLLVMVVSWLRTEGGLDHYANRAIALYETLTGTAAFTPGTYENGDEKPRRYVREEWVAEHVLTLEDLTLTFRPPFLDREVVLTPLATTDLAEIEFVAKPADWRDHDTARRRFRAAWCKREGLELAICPRLSVREGDVSEDTQRLRDAWCSEPRSLDDTACDERFRDLRRTLDGAWERERRHAVSRQQRLDLADRDLRNARMAGVFLVNANLGRARLDGADLAGARLEGADLFGARLEGADLNRAGMEGADLSWARLEGANLGGTRLERANLFNARLEGANLAGARLEGAYLGWALLEGADLGEARLEGANLSEARLEGANLAWARLEGADLSLARLEGANLYSARLEGAYLGRARLEGASLNEARLERADFAGARLQGANLGGAQLEGANLRGARLEGVNLAGARLERANLSEARLEGANLAWARLEGANLEWPRLQGADLRGASFKSALWAGGMLRAPAHQADFRAGIGLTQAHLAGVIGNARTLLPDGDAPDTGEPFYVWSCWATPPPELDAMVEQAKSPFEDEDDLRRKWLCAEGKAPERTGTPLAADAEPP